MDDFDCGIRPENVPLIRGLLGVPMSDPRRTRSENRDLAVRPNVEIADEIGNGMLIACSTLTLKYRYRGGSPSSVVSPIEHASLPYLVDLPDQIQRLSQWLHLKIYHKNFIYQQRRRLCSGALSRKRPHNLICAFQAISRTPSVRPPPSSASRG